MSSFCSLLRQRRAVTLADIEAATANQACFGGDLGLNLMDVGAIRENALQRLLSEQHELPVGPTGMLALPSAELSSLLPRAMARRYRVLPVKRTSRTLHVAIAEPLDPDSEKELRQALGMQLRPVLVTSARLAQGLSRYCGMSLPSHVTRVLDVLDEGRRARELDDEATGPSPGPPPPASAPYRRMSERPDGIRPSSRQPHLSAPRVPGAASEPLVDGPPDTLEGVGPDPAVQTRRDTPPPPSMSRLDQGLDIAPAAAPRQRVRRDTDPWVGDSDELVEEAPVSIGRAFHRSLPPSGLSSESGAEGRLGFRHRGPFTAEQAAEAASQARDVQTVLEVTARFARQFFERMVLLTVSAERAEARIVHDAGGTLSSVELDLTQASLFQRARRDAQPVIDGLGHDGVDALLRERLGLGDAAAPVAVVPVTIRERVVALVFGSDGREGVDPMAVEDVARFTDLASMELARIILSRKRS